MINRFCISYVFRAIRIFYYSFGTNVNTTVLFGDMGTAFEGHFVLQMIFDIVRKCHIYINVFQVC